MNKKFLIIIAVILLVLMLVTLAVVAYKLSFSGQPGEDVDDNQVSALTEKEARSIAEEYCIEGGKTLTTGSYNKTTKKWWFEANLNTTRQGCQPACVVDEKTKTAEINWRCDSFLPKPEEPMTNECGLANCHGLKIECGKPAEICTEMYQLGDNCRQFAECGVIDGKCQQIENPKFDACKSCVQKCERDFPQDMEKQFMCESKCI